MTTRILWVALLLALVTPAAQAAPQPDDYRRLNESLVAQHVLPRYGALSEATSALKGTAGTFCTQPTAETLATLRDRYVAALDAWEGIQHVRFGPVELFMRGTRLAFWPDTRNSVTKQLEELLAARDPNAITVEAFGHGSIAAQGFPALERLLYGDEAEAALLTASEDATFRCTLIEAVATNLADIVAGIRHDWTEGESSYARLIADAGDANDRYRDPQEATLDLFKALYNTVELVADHKLARPLGASLTEAKPRLAESWRSGRSLENIRLNLAAGEAMYLGEGGDRFSNLVLQAGEADLDALLRRAFAQTRATADAIPVPLESAVSDAAARPKVEQLLKEATALKTLLAQRLTAALAIPLGFNALDGD